ncbi:hypothetical protein GCM10027299_13320 [Larkinella ripae]
MIRFFFFLWLLPGLALAQPAVRIDRLPPQGILLNQGWKWQAGDQLEWATPLYNDRGWKTIDPTQDIMNLAEVRRAATGWFRIRLVVSAAVRTESLALLVEQTGASEIYLDGRLLYRFGQVGAKGRAIGAYDPRGLPLSFLMGTDSLHTLAIRFSFANDLPYTVSFARQNRNPLLRVTLNGVTNAVRYDQVHRQGGLPLDYLKMGIYFILTVLHLALYLYYPVQRANLYFFLYALSCLFTYGLQVYSIGVNSVETLQHIRIAIGIFTTLFQLLQLRALYSLFKRPPGGPYWFLTIYFLSCIPLTVWPYRLGLNYGHGLFYLLCFGESLRVTVLAARQKKRGAGIIGRGVVVALVFTVIHSLLLPYGSTFRDQFFLTGKAWYFVLQHLPYNLSNQSIPIAISLYLGLEFAFTSRTLGTKLAEIEDLSAQTRAQEAEKLQLVARQKEQLEQTVRERTDQLQRQTDKLQEMDAYKSRFFTNLTHEFRTPLTLILGPAEQVLAQTAESQTRQQVELIQRNASRLLRLINQLLDLSKLEAGKMSLSTAPGDLVSLVRGTLQSFESVATQKAITLQFTTTQPQLVVHFDQDKLEKILYNLLSNALKFTPAGGAVWVSLAGDDSRPESGIQLSIQDTGVGIPAAKQPYVFDRFYQADVSDTREQEGTGIGLALTKELVDLHGGSLHLSSREGFGTLVVVQLPLQPGSPEVAITEQAFRPDQTISLPSALPAELEDAPLVLLIEDNDDVRAFIRSSLKSTPGVASYRILEAPNGEAGLQLAQQQVPDLVITDLMMPKMDGYAVCATLKRDERTSHIPVVMLTARVDLESKLEGLETGADVYLAKPFNQRELRVQITNLLRVRHQLRERYSRATLGQSTPGRQDFWQSAARAMPSMEQVFLTRVRTAIENHLDDEQYSVERLSDAVGMSRTQLHRKLKALTNEAPGDLIRILRLQRAHELLSGNVGTVAEVAYQVGFGNPANFSTSFSRQFGYPPSEVRKKPGPSQGQ